MIDFKELAVDFIDAVRIVVNKSIAPLLERISDLEKKAAVVPRDGKDGKDAEMNYGMVRALVDASVEEAVAKLPKAQDGTSVDIDEVVVAVLNAIETPTNGKDGEDGKSVDIDALELEIARLVAVAFEAIPKPTNGKDGDPGLNGRDGKDADPIDLAVVREIAVDIISKLELPKGEPGEPGPPGPSVKGDKGDKGENGRDGKDAKDGRDGRDAKDGAPGRDALEIEIVSIIDPTRSYSRGTFATYRGGLVRAARTTDPLDGLEESGWCVIIEGVANTGAYLEDDGRTIRLEQILTSGRVSRNVFKLPTMIHRGVWVDGPYTKGDVVTWNGCQWHCEVEESTGKPGECKDWVQIVKKGRDGKDGKNGTNGKDAKDVVKITNIDPTRPY